jgi:hypothetical protein
LTRSAANISASRVKAAPGSSLPSRTAAIRAPSSRPERPRASAASAPCRRESESTASLSARRSRRGSGSSRSPGIPTAAAGDPPVYTPRSARAVWPPTARRPDQAAARPGNGQGTATPGARGILRRHQPPVQVAPCQAVERGRSPPGASEIRCGPGGLVRLAVAKYAVAKYGELASRRRARQVRAALCRLPSARSRP